ASNSSGRAARISIPDAVTVTPPDPPQPRTAAPRPRIRTLSRARKAVRLRARGAAIRQDSLRNRFRPTGEQPPETVLVENRHAQLLGLGGLGAGRITDDDECRLLRYRTRRLTAADQDRLLGLVTRKPLQRTGYHDGQALERALDGGVALVFHAHAGGPPLLHDGAMPVDGEPFDHGGGNGRADAVDGGQLQ